MNIRPIGTWPDRLPSFVDRVAENAFVLLTRSVIALDARWRGIAIGKDCRFYGRPVLRRFPESQIIIGPGSSFRSSDTSALSGLDRRCCICTFRSGARIQIAESCGFSGTAIGADVEIIIGRNVMCGANSVITDTDAHPVDAQKRLAGEPGKALPVRIEDNVWLGMNVVVLKGVTIGRNSVISANSVVTRSIPAGVIAAGHPARVVGEVVAEDTLQPIGSKRTILFSKS